MKKLAIPAGRGRYLTPGHIRFFRAALDGVELHRAWQYVELDEDAYTPALAQFTVAWIRETTMAACMSAGYPELVGLFRRDPQRVKVEGTPSLEEFTARYEHGEAFSQSEMLELYHEQYGINRAAERRTRLQARLRQAFELLAQKVYRAPKTSDGIGQWLAPPLVEHLQSARLYTLGDVRASLNRKKTARWEEVPGIGEVWANRLNRWLDEHVIVVAPDSPSLTVAVPSPFQGLGLASVPVDGQAGKQTEMAVAQSWSPVGASSSGNGGKEAWWPYPAQHNRLHASSDAHAIKIWLDAKAPHDPDENNATKMTLTRRAYSRIAERFLFWVQLEANISLPQFAVEHCIHYRTWLHDLGRKSEEEWSAAGWRLPAGKWIGRRGIPREAAAWKPFEGSLSKASIAQELTVVRALFKYLLEGGITQHNPWSLMGKGNFATPFAADSDQYVSRSLTQVQRDDLMAGLDLDDELQARLALILWLGFGCGLRSAEMIALSFKDLVISPEKWALKVTGKGKRKRTVPLSTPVKNAVLRYMATIGLDLEFIIRASSGLDAQTADQPILRTQRGRRKRNKEDGKRLQSTPLDRMSYQTLNRVIKEHFETKAKGFAQSDPVSAARLGLASMHWLRHSCAVHANRNKVPLNAIQRLLGHSNISTTSRYLTEEAEVLADAMEAFLGA